MNLYWAEPEALSDKILKNHEISNSMCKWSGEVDTLTKDIIDFIIMNYN